MSNNNSNGKTISIAQLKQFDELKNVTDEEAQKMINDLHELSLIIASIILNEIKTALA